MHSHRTRWVGTACGKVCKSHADDCIQNILCTHENQESKKGHFGIHSTLPTTQTSAICLPCVHNSSNACSRPYWQCALHPSFRSTREYISADRPINVWLHGSCGWTTHLRLWLTMKIYFTGFACRSQPLYFSVQQIQLRYTIAAKVTIGANYNGLNMSHGWNHGKALATLRQSSVPD